MKVNTSIILVFFISGLATSHGFANEGGSFEFEITHGLVIQTPSFCAPDSCKAREAKLAGTFTAKISDSSISFANIDVSISPDISFTLPNDPDYSSNGVSRSIDFRFNGKQLTAAGKIDSRAFDGPLVEYKFAADMLGTVDGNDDFNQYGFFTALRDFRKCISPLFGGFFVKQVNKRRTRCADGRLLRECYVASIDWEKLGFKPAIDLGIGDIRSRTPILLQGKIEAKNFEHFGNLGVFRAKAAYRSATERTAGQLFVGLQNNGIVCITTPCFSFDQYILNRKRIRTVSNVNLEKVGATAEQLETADSILANGGVLIASGFNEQIEEMTGTGIAFIANQIYLPIKPAIDECPDGYTLTDEVCKTPFGCIAPELELSTIGGVGFVDPTTGEIIAKIDKSCVASCDPPAISDGPGRCTLALP